MILKFPVDKRFKSPIDPGTFMLVSKRGKARPFTPDMYADNKSPKGVLLGIKRGITELTQNGIAII